MFCVRDKKKLCVCRPGVVVCMPLIPAVYSNLIQDSESKPVSQKKKKFLVIVPTKYDAVSFSFTK